MEIGFILFFFFLNGGGYVFIHQSQLVPPTWWSRQSSLLLSILTPFFFATIDISYKPTSRSLFTFLNLHLLHLAIQIPTNLGQVCASPRGGTLHTSKSPCAGEGTGAPHLHLQLHSLGGLQIYILDITSHSFTGLHLNLQFLSLGSLQIYIPVINLYT